MTAGDQSTAVAIAAIIIFLIGGIWLLIKQRPVCAGLIMTFASLLPLTWQVTFTDSSAPGFAFLLILMLPTAIGVTACGAIWWLFLRFSQEG